MYKPVGLLDRPYYIIYASSKKPYACNDSIIFLEIVNDVNSKEKLCTEPSSFTSLFNKLYSKEIH